MYDSIKVHELAMSKIPKFELYGKGDVAAEQSIQPTLSFRQWSDLSKTEKQIALNELENRGWIETASSECLSAIGQRVVEADIMNCMATGDVYLFDGKCSISIDEYRLFVSQR